MSILFVVKSVQITKYTENKIHPRNHHHSQEVVTGVVSVEWTHLCSTEVDEEVESRGVEYGCVKLTWFLILKVEKKWRMNGAYDRLQEPGLQVPS